MGSFWDPFGEPKSTPRPCPPSIRSDLVFDLVIGWSQDGSKTVPRGLRGGFLGRLGGVLGRSWGLLGPLWTVFWGSQAALGRSWALLGGSWGGLGPLLGALGPSWDGLGGHLGTMRSQDRKPVAPGQWSAGSRGRFWLPKWVPKRPQDDPQTTQKSR